MFHYHNFWKYVILSKELRSERNTFEEQSDNFKCNVRSKCKVFPVPKRQDISEYEASGSKGPCGMLFDILTNLALEMCPLHTLSYE